MTSHRCPGEDYCHICQTAIDRREFGDERSGDDDAGERDYEAFYDRMWGDAS